MGVIKEDTRSLDSSSYEQQSIYFDRISGRSKEKDMAATLLSMALKLV